MSIRFLLVLQNFETWLITTPFAEDWQLQQWLNGVQSVPTTAREFVDDPIANLPPRSFANFVVDEEYHDFKEVGAIKPNDPLLDRCHGTLMVDDNKSIFYSVRNRNAEWKLPYCISQT